MRPKKYRKFQGIRKVPLNMGRPVLTETDQWTLKALMAAKLTVRSPFPLPKNWAMVLPVRQIAGPSDVTDPDLDISIYIAAADKSPRRTGRPHFVSREHAHLAGVYELPYLP